MGSRYRCAACGNRTRFTVTVTRRSRSFHHFDLGGELSVEDEEILDEEVESVACRWCADGGQIEIEPAPA
jgi:hypothetical protein